MEKHILLVKCFETNEKLRKQIKKSNFISENDHIISKLSRSSRDLLGYLLINECRNQRNIAKHLNVSSQAVSEMIKKLIKLDLVVSKVGIINNEKLITLTALGVLVAKELDYRVRQDAIELFKNFSDDEVDCLFRLLNKIT